MAGEHLDLASEIASVPAAAESSRRYVGIHFACCGVYARVYVNRAETAYEGHCPRCSQRVELKIGPGGTESRFFTAY
jgi:hypothetical protein